MTEVEVPPESVYERVHAVLAALPAIGKDQEAPREMGGYRFRGIEDITAALKPALAEHGVFFTPETLERVDSVRQTASNKNLYVVDVHVRFKFYGVGGDSFCGDVWGQGSDSGDKAVSKAYTSALKSLLGQTFCISDAETDAERHNVPETYEGPAPPEGFASFEGAKETIDTVRRRVRDLGLVDWVNDQGFPWPWSYVTCGAILAKCVATCAEAEEESAPFAAAATSVSSADDVPPAPHLDAASTGVHHSPEGGTVAAVTPQDNPSPGDRVKNERVDAEVL